MTKKKKTRRNQAKHPELERKYALKSRQDSIETEYVDGVCDSDGNQVIRALNEEEKDWLNQFYKETVSANLKNAVFYTTKEEKRRLYGENNARNRCIYTRSKAQGALIDLENVKVERNRRFDLGEDVMISEIED